MSLCKVLCVSTVLVLLVTPWIVATILSWIYTGVFEQTPEDPTQPKLGWISAILQTVSVAVYLVYIVTAVLCIGIVGRRSLFSFCCLVMGIPVFAVAPMVVGVVILYTALTASDESVEEIGIAVGVCGLLSTSTCCFVLCWAMICGGKGRGKNHRYPIPLAYFPYLKDFHEVRKEEEVDDSDKYTSDYPPPLYTFADHKPLSPNTFTRTAK